MPEPITETTPATTTTTGTSAPATTIVVEGQGTAGAPTTPAPSKTSTESTPATTTPSQPSKEEVQKRIDRMYARLQEERKQRLAAEALSKSKQPVTTTDDDEDGDDDGDKSKQVKAITEADIESIVERKDREKKLVECEVGVFSRHPTALNEDGSYNTKDPFVQKYMEIARANPLLATMTNGPELAEALADKELGIDYKKGRSVEAARATAATNSFTTTSTVAIPPTTNAGELTPSEKKIAKGMGMSEAEYSKNKQSNKVVQRSWEVKAR